MDYSNGLSMQYLYRVLAMGSTQYPQDVKSHMAKKILPTTVIEAKEIPTRYGEGKAFYFFIMRTIKPWHRLSSVVVQFSFSGVFKT